MKSLGFGYLWKFLSDTITWPKEAPKILVKYSDRMVEG